MPNNQIQNQNNIQQNQIQLNNLPVQNQNIATNIGFDKVVPFELIYQDIEVYAQIKTEYKNQEGKTKKHKVQKNILKKCSGKFQPYTFTAILGPSGSGKTTLLNLLSGRLLSQNLKIYGKLKVNGTQTDNINQYKNCLGYVMQQNYMLPTFTPFEAFKFIADLRLAKKSQDQKVETVKKIIQFLQLSKCQSTYCGDQRIRGISGGQKKRTSIGIQLLINPSIIFLDEPTTGLDSTTALHLIIFLNKLARTGRTVVSTIHQPSSEIFSQFNKLVMIVNGSIIYQGGARQSMFYFRQIQFQVPKHSNPTDHYMKIMNKQGIMFQYMQQDKSFTEQQITIQFQQRLNYLIESYSKLLNYNADNIENKYINQITSDDQIYRTSWLKQFFIIFKRNWINQFRQPLDFILKVSQSIFFGVVAIILYSNKATSPDIYIQNFRGVMFFLTMNTGFTFVFSSVNLFNFERPIFIRERLSNTYVTSAYFWGRSLAVLPVEIFTPFLFLTICYFVVNINQSFGSYILALLAIQSLAWMASSYGLVLSTIFKDASVVMALVPALIIPLLLVGGFFAPLNQVNIFFQILSYLSMFRYGYEALVQSQLSDNILLINGQSPSNPPITKDFFAFTLSYWINIILMLSIGSALRLLSLFLMWYISNPKLMKLDSPKKENEAVQIKANPLQKNIVQINGNSQKINHQTQNRLKIINENKQIDIEKIKNK